MKNVKIYLFSGTGNTRKVTNEFARVLRERGVAVKVEEIDRNPDIEEGAEVLGIAYPVHAFSAPENIINFAKGLPECKVKTPIFFIKSSGEPLSLNDASSAKLRTILTKKGYDAVAEYHYVMPYNMLYKHTESMATKMWFTAQRMIVKDVNSLLNGEKNKIGRGTPISFIFREVEQPFMHFNGRHFKVDEEKCVSCNMCVNKCPQKNITVKNGRIGFGKNCIGCVRCSFNCPTDAIKIGIINMWKVNGAYVYGQVEPEVAECKYLKRAYASYFEKNV